MDILAIATRFASALDICDFAEEAEHLSLNDAGKMICIVHEELPGEREALEAFFVRHRVRR